MDEAMTGSSHKAPLKSMMRMLYSLDLPETVERTSQEIMIRLSVSGMREPLSFSTIL